MYNIRTLYQHVRISYQPAPKIRICRYVCTRATSKKKKRAERPAHAQGATHAQRDTEGVAAVSWIESLMIRRPFGSIDPNSIRETELHTECRRRHSRGERESLHSTQHDRVRDAARQRAAATRRMETDKARAERCVCDCLRVSSRTHLVRRRNEY